MSPPTSPTTSTIFATTPPRTVLPRSQPPRHQSTPVVPNAGRQQSVPMAATTSLPPSVPPPHAPHHAPSTASSTTSASASSSSFRPSSAFTPATSVHNASSGTGTGAGPSRRPKSPPPPPVPASGRPSASSGSGSAGASIPVVPMSTSQVPQTGASKMAAAAKRGVTGVDGLARSRRGSQLTAWEEAEDHPLSEKCLKAREYQTIHTLSHLFHLPSRWNLIRPLGQGAYGLVISVQDQVSGEPVAVKCITRVFDKVMLARRALREITLLRHFGDHENLTALIDLDNVWFGYNEIYLYMEPMEADLHQIIRSGQALGNPHVQYFTYQLLRGMKYVHSANVIHRDLKPGNLLVNADCELKICDFGLARGFKPVAGEADPNDPKLTEYVATRWYRAPEIMLSNRRYTTAIDVWSIGCILGELLGGKPMFQGKDFVEQLNLILEAVGTPSDDVLAGMASEKALAYMRTLPIHKKRAFADILPNADADAIDLLEKLLLFAPQDRLDVVTALEHRYVGLYHDPLDEPSCPTLFDKWEEVEGLETVAELREAVTREIEEFRAEVRNVVLPDEDEHEFYEEDEDEVEVEGEGEGDTEATITISPAKPTGTAPDPSVSPTLSQKDLGLGLSPRTTTHPLPPIHRSRSRGRGNTPGSPAVDDHTGAGMGAPISRTSSRRTSGYSMQGRRPASFLFSPFGNGMTPLPSTMVNAPSNLNAISSGTNTANTGSSAGPGPGPGGQGHAHSASVDYYTGRRSRAPSATGDFSLRPLIRHLSTVGMGVGGDDGVPVPGAESGKPGLGLEGLPPTHAHVHGGPGADDGGAGLPVVDRGLPPMPVSPSDAPPSTAPKTFGLGQKPSGPPTPQDQ